MRDYIIFGSGTYGRRVLEYVGAERVHCFVDNDIRKVGTRIEGIIINSFQYLLEHSDDCQVIISVNLLYYPEVKKQLLDHDVDGFTSYYELIENIDPEEVFGKLGESTRYKDIHKGGRCFILGNGPSLNDLEPDWLKGETVFGVNSIYKWNQYEKLDISYLVVSDPVFWARGTNCYETYDETYLLEHWNKLKSGNARVFCPLDAYCFLKHSNQTNRVSFFHHINGEDIPEEISISRLPCLYTVVQYAICIAIYMGFDEIYLLGCDTSILLSEMSRILEGNSPMGLHAYGDTKEEEYKERNTSYYGFEHALFENYQMFKAYRQINDYCKDKGILFKNLSTKTTLDMIPRDCIENIVKVEK